MKILLPLLETGIGNQPFFDLATDLQALGEITVVSHEPSILEHAQKIGCQTYHLERERIPLPRGLQWAEALPLPKIVHDAIHEYGLHYRWKRQTQTLLQDLQPETALLSGDYHGIYYYLCQNPQLRTVVVQITSIPLSLTDKRLFLKGNTTFRRRWVTLGMRLLNQLTGLSFVGWFQGEAYLPHGSELGKTIGGALAGFQHSMIKGSFADYFCVNGPYFAEILPQTGAIQAEIVVTGNPTDDRLVATKATLTPETKHAFKQAANIPADYQIVSLFVEPYNNLMLGGHDYKAEVEELVLKLSQLPLPIALILKTHPRHGVDCFQDLARPPLIQVWHSQRSDNDLKNVELIGASEVVITRTSSTGFKALALDIPLVTYSRYDLPIERDYQYAHGVYHLTTLADLLATVQQLLTDSSTQKACLARQSQLREKYMQLDGKVWERIGAVLQGTLS